MLLLSLLLLGLGAEAATVPTRYDVPANQDIQPAVINNNNNINGREHPPQGYGDSDDNGVSYREYYPKVSPGSAQPNRMPYLYDQRNAVYDPRSSSYGRPNIQNQDFQSGYFPYRYEDPGYGYPPWYPYRVPYGPQNNYYPYYYPYTFNPYIYGPPPYSPPYGNYVNRPQYSDQAYFNGNPTNQPYPNAGQGNQPSGGNQAQEGIGNVARQPNYGPNWGTGSQGQWNEGTWQYGANRPNDQLPYPPIPYNPMSTIGSGSAQPFITSGSPVGRPEGGNRNDQDQYLYLNGQVGQTLPNISGGLPFSSSYEPLPQQNPSRPSGPRENAQGQYLFLDQASGQNVPTLVGGVPYNPTSQTVPQQPPRYQETGSDMPPNVQGIVNGQQYPTQQQGISGNPLTPEEIQAIFGQQLNSPSLESQESQPANPAYTADPAQVDSDPAVPSGAGTLAQGLQTPGNGQSVYLVNGKPLPPEFMDEVRRIQSGMTVGNTGK